MTGMKAKRLFLFCFLVKVPRSVCSDPCLPGMRKLSRKGEPFCCFDCLLCTGGHFSNITGRCFFGKSLGVYLLCACEVKSRDKAIGGIHTYVICMLFVIRVCILLRAYNENRSVGGIETLPHVT